MGETIDRRVQRTHRLLKQGLAELMLEKNFKDISVKEITDRVQLNRSTFYLHFADTHELLYRLENDTLAEVKEMILAHSEEIVMDRSLIPVFGPLLDYITSNYRVCDALFNHSVSDNFTKEIYEIFYTYGVYLIHQKYPHAPKNILDCTVHFLIYGLIGLLRKWFDHEMSISKQEMLQLANRLVYSTMEGTLTPQPES